MPSPHDPHEPQEAVYSEDSPSKLTKSTLSTKRGGTLPMERGVEVNRHTSNGRRGSVRNVSVNGVDGRVSRLGFDEYRPLSTDWRAGVPVLSRGLPTASSLITNRRCWFILAGFLLVLVCAPFLLYTTSGPMMVPEVIRSLEQSVSSGPMAPGIRSLEQSESSFLKVDGDEVVSEGNTSNIPLDSGAKKVGNLEDRNNNKETKESIVYSSTSSMANNEDVDVPNHDDGKNGDNTDDDGEKGNDTDDDTDDDDGDEDVADDKAGDDGDKEVDADEGESFVYQYPDEEEDDEDFNDSGDEDEIKDDTLQDFEDTGKMTGTTETTPQFTEEENTSVKYQGGEVTEMELETTEQNVEITTSGVVSANISKKDDRDDVGRIEGNIDVYGQYRLLDNEQIEEYSKKELKETEGDCKTLKGYACIFPVMYGGFVWHRCIPNGGGAWCPTSMTRENQYSTWDYCDPRHCHMMHEYSNKFI